MKATAYYVDGTFEELVPENGTDFSLAELQDVVEGSIDIKELPKTNEVIVLNDNGKLEGLPKNKLATEVWKKAYPIAEYSFNNDELIVGNVIVCDSKMVK